MIDFNLAVMSLVQGIGELLPISSSINLFLIEKLFHANLLNFSLKIALHVGNLIVLLIYFGKEIGEIIKASFIRKNSIKATYFWHLFFGTIPVTILGFLGRDYVSQFENSTVMGWFCIIFGIFLYIADRIAPAYQKSDITILKSFVVGCFQAISIFPGVSRLGITITSCRMLGINRKKAVFFSLFLTIPGILGSLCLEFFKTDCTVLFSNTSLLGVAITAVISMITIIPCIKFMEKKGFFAIMLYRCIIGIIILYL